MSGMGKKSTISNPRKTRMAIIKKHTKTFYACPLLRFAFLLFFYFYFYFYTADSLYITSCLPPSLPSFLYNHNCALCTYIFTYLPPYLPHRPTDGFLLLLLLFLFDLHHMHWFLITRHNLARCERKWIIPYSKEREERKKERSKEKSDPRGRKERE